MNASKMHSSRGRKVRIFVCSGGANSLTGFRFPLLKYFVKNGYEVVAAACENDEKVKEKLAKEGIHFIAFPCGRASINPFSDFLFLYRLSLFLKKERFDVAFLFQQKAVLYGGIAAKIARTPKIFAMITGLGYAFIPQPGIKFKIVNFVASTLYKISTKFFSGMLFQNPDDLNFIKSKFLQKTSLPLKRVYGSGVDLDEFSFSQKDETKSFIFVGRLIRDKGIFEFIEAAKLIKAAGTPSEFRILGGIDENPAAIKIEKVKVWERENVCKYLGRVPDVRKIVAETAVFVLPTYREGTPRSALEAMALGKPIITTNAVGAREVVFFEKNCKFFDEKTNEFLDLPLQTNPREHEEKILLGDNGFLVPVKDAKSLSIAMNFYLENPDKIKIHGEESRRLAEKFYDVKKINSEILEFITGTTKK